MVCYLVSLQQSKASESPSCSDIVPGSPSDFHGYVDIGLLEPRLMLKNFQVCPTTSLQMLLQGCRYMVMFKTSANNYTYQEYYLLYTTCHVTIIVFTAYGEAPTRNSRPGTPKRQHQGMYWITTVMTPYPLRGIPLTDSTSGA